MLTEEVKEQVCRDLGWGGHSRQRMASAKVLWWPGPAGLMGTCDLCGHIGPQA